jgi:hypothetical protein
MSRPRRSETVLTAEHLRRVLLYDPYTGLWRWRQGGKGRPKEPDWWPGTLTRWGYRSIAIGRLGYYVHRLAFLYMTGAWPRHEADHIDGDRSDNRWGNLRDATGSQNKRNAGLRKDNTTGFRGVYRHNQTGAFVARIKIGDKRITLGSFDTAEQASEAYERAAKESFGLFYRKIS